MMSAFKVFQSEMILYTFIKQRLMKKMIVESIQQLKKEKEDQSNKDRDKTKTDKVENNQALFKSNNPIIDQEKRKKEREEGIFRGFSFCFPIVDIELTPKTIELLTANIEIEEGKVSQFKGKILDDHVNFILINKSMKISYVREKVDKKIKYDQILDYKFITESLKQSYQLDYENYSLYVNGLGQIQAQQQFKSKEEDSLNNSSKKRKLQQKEDKEDALNDSEHTIRLSDYQQEIQVEDKLKIKNEDQEVWIKQDLQEAMISTKLEKHDFSMNQFLADQLTKMQKIYQTERDIGRKIAYMKAAAVIRSLDKQIQSQKDVQNIKGIGKKIADKVKELIQTGKLGKLQKLQQSEQTIICQQFCKIWGIGPSKAQQLYKLGIRSIDELKKRTDLLTKNQKLGLKYHDQFQTKIPRQKVTKIFEYVKQVISKIVSSLDNYRIQVCGSYRRQKPTCGDIDIIISRKDGVYEKNLLFQIVNELERVGFLTDHLTHPKAPLGRSCISYMGVCRFEEPTHHRMDIKYYPIEQFAYAILYFTGSGMFNRMLRLHTMKLGLQLSDHGAVPKMEKGIIWKSPIPVCLTEQDIFRYLKLEYKAPKDRDL